MRLAPIPVEKIPQVLRQITYMTWEVNDGVVNTTTQTEIVYVEDLCQRVREVESEAGMLLRSQRL